MPGDDGTKRHRKRDNWRSENEKRRRDPTVPVKASTALTDEEKAQILRLIKDGDFERLITAGATESEISGVTQRMKKAGIGFLKQNKINVALLIISILAADDKAEALGEAIDPFAAISGLGVAATDSQEADLSIRIIAWRALAAQRDNVASAKSSVDARRLNNGDDAEKKRRNRTAQSVWKGMGMK